MPDIIERNATCARQLLECGAEIERLQREHDDYVVRANANVCELNREIERLRLDARAYANVELSEENDRLIDEVARLRTALEVVLADLAYGHVFEKTKTVLLEALKTR